MINTVKTNANLHYILLYYWTFSRETKHMLMINRDASTKIEKFIDPMSGVKSKNGHIVNMY